MALPIFASDSQPMHLMQTAWASKLNPVLANPATSGLLLKNVKLSSGANTINHLLGRPLQGWCIVRQRAAAAIYDSQDANLQPTLTLALQASAPVTVDLYVF